MLEEIDRCADTKDKLQDAQSEVEAIRQAMKGLTITHNTEARAELENERQAAEAKLQATEKELEKMMGNLSLTFPRSAKQRAAERRTQQFLNDVGTKRARENSGSPGEKPLRSMSVLRVIVFYMLSFREKTNR